MEPITSTLIAGFPMGRNDLRSRTLCSVHGTEHRSIDVDQALIVKAVGQQSPEARHGVPNHKPRGYLTVVEENAAVAAVAHSEVTQDVVGHGRGAGPCGRDKAVGGAQLMELVEETKHRRFPVELAVATVEGGVGEEAAPWLGKEGEAGKARGLVRRETEEDLVDELVRQVWRQRRRIVRRARRQRRHGLLGELGKPKAGEERS
ncbi:hypothetical protein ACQ4PT_042995 [Festuca glaucescens]